MGKRLSQLEALIERRGDYYEATLALVALGKLDQAQHAVAQGMGRQYTGELRAGLDSIGDINSRQLQDIYALDLEEIRPVFHVQSGGNTSCAYALPGYLTSSGYPMDADADSVLDDIDNCPKEANVFQGDSDADGVGNACEVDGLAQRRFRGLLDSLRSMRGGVSR